MISILLVLFTMISISLGDDYQCGDLVSVEDFHQHAKDHLEREAFSYIDGVAMAGDTYRENLAAFKRLRILPRYLRNVTQRSLKTTILGTPVSLPLGISPHGTQKIAHPEGENGTAKAAEKAGIVMVLSVFSTTSLEEVAKAAPNGIHWIQIKIFNDRNLTLDIIKRAEKAGYKALVLLVDSPILGVRYFKLKDQYFHTYANFDIYMQSKFDFITYTNDSHLRYGSDLATTWEDIPWIRQHTKLPIVVKGILTAEDAEMAVQYGASAIYVSNHGGRQLDGSPATIEVLPEIVQRVKGRVEVYLDGGIRSGADVFKALALGAKAVFYGRPNLYGLSFDGHVGSECITDIFKRDLSTVMALAGFTSVNAINNSAVKHENYFRN